MAGVLTITTTHHVPIGTSGLDEFLSAHDNVTVVCQPLPAVLRDCKDIETAPLPAAGPDAHEVPARVLFLLTACCATATDDLLSSTVPAFLAVPSRAFIQRVLSALITGGLTIPPDSKLALLLDRASSLAATLTQQGDTSFMCAPTDLARLRARGDPHIIGHSNLHKPKKKCNSFFFSDFSQNRSRWIYPSTGRTIGTDNGARLYL